jgi:hypothetical protein
MVKVELKNKIGSDIDDCLDEARSLCCFSYFSIENMRIFLICLRRSIRLLFFRNLY